MNVEQCKDKKGCYFSANYYISASRKHKYPALNCKLWDICLRQGVSTACRAILRQLMLGLILTQECRSKTIKTSVIQSRSGLNTRSKFHWRSKYCIKCCKTSRQQKNTVEINILKTTTGEKKKWPSHVMLT